MSQQQAILRAIDFFEDHLQEPVSVADAADAAGYSLYHFCRVFARHTRHTPYDYLIRRRMTLAANDILQTNRKIIDIAFDYQFESHEGFTRAFGRMFLCPPHETRLQGAVLALRRLPRITAAHLVTLESQNGLVPEVGHCEALPPAFELIAVPQYWPANEDSLATPESILAGACAHFCLQDVAQSLPLILDWVLHGWLFFTSHTMRFPVLLHTSEALVVPLT